MYTYINLVNKYDQKTKKSFRKEAQERYQNLSKEEKEKRRKKALGRHENLSEEEKQKSVNIIGIKICIFLKKKNKGKLNI